MIRRLSRLRMKKLKRRLKRSNPKKKMPRSLKTRMQVMMKYLQPKLVPMNSPRRLQLLQKPLSRRLHQRQLSKLLQPKERKKPLPQLQFRRSTRSMQRPIKRNLA